MRALKKLPIVEADVVEAAEWYDERQPGLGDRFIAVLQGAEKILLDNPLRFPVRYTNMRRLNLADFPYAIFFFLDDEDIVVIGVLHVRRDTRTILERRQKLLG